MVTVSGLRPVQFSDDGPKGRPRGAQREDHQHSAKLPDVHDERGAYRNGQQEEEGRGALRREIGQRKAGFLGGLQLRGLAQMRQQKEEDQRGNRYQGDFDEAGQAHDAALRKRTSPTNPPSKPVAIDRYAGPIQRWTPSSPTTPPSQAPTKA